MEKPREIQACENEDCYFFDKDYVEKCNRIYPIQDCPIFRAQERIKLKEEKYEEISKRNRRRSISPNP